MKMIGLRKANKYAKLILDRAGDMPDKEVTVIASVNIVRLIDHHLHGTFPYPLKFSDKKNYIALKNTVTDGDMTHIYVLTILGGNPNDD